MRTCLAEIIIMSARGVSSVHHHFHQACRKRAGPPSRVYRMASTRNRLARPDVGCPPRALQRRRPRAASTGAMSLNKQVSARPGAVGRQCQPLKRSRRVCRSRPPTQPEITTRLLASASVDCSRPPLTRTIVLTGDREWADARTVARALAELESGRPCDRGRRPRTGCHRVLYRQPCPGPCASTTVQGG